jgi:hypothetical protein
MSQPKPARRRQPRPTPPPGTRPRAAQPVNEQPHRAGSSLYKKWTRPRLGFKAAHSAAVILGGIELIDMIRKGQLIRTDIRNLPIAHQLNGLAC